MKSTSAVAAFSLSLALSGCGNGVNRNNPPPADKPDLADTFHFDDDAGPPPGDDGGSEQTGPDYCADDVFDPNCQGIWYGPPAGQFPLQSDQNKDPLERDNGVNRDNNGWLRLDSTHSSFNYLWIANDQDLSAAGSVSKIDSKTVREVARYRTVTCYSLKTGSTAQCDGTTGCCSIDDWPRYQARKMHQQQPGHLQVQMSSNSPSRTSVDFNGDLFISNRAFSGQSSVTKIANDPAQCVDRNHNGRIDTSKDSSGNGFIEVDCNGDGAPDDIAGVKAKPCTNGLPQEFYGVDDECIIWTSNTFPSNAVGRPLGLAQGANDASSSDAWAGSFNLGQFVRIDGITGLDKDDVQLPGECYNGGTGPYGVAVDSQGIGWTPDLWDGKLCYFDTKNNQNVGSVRDPQWGRMRGYGVTMDRDQNVWIGAGVERYTPDRSNGFKNLGNGWWTQITGSTGIGIAADSRTANAYFVYSCQNGGVLQIPASTIKTMKMDQQVAPNGWTRIAMGCYGVGVDADQNVWGVDMSTSTRAVVDKMGVVVQPHVGAPMGNNKCPAGDSCPNAGAYTYSDFTGFGLRNFTRPQGSYQVIVKGCADNQGNPLDTQWYSVQWDADVPPNTTLSVHAKSGRSLSLNDASWSVNQFTMDAGQSPLDLQAELTPNWTRDTPPEVTVDDQFLMVEFVFKTSTQNGTPKLKSFSVGYKCNPIPG